jgi:hypothetical protein
MDREESKMYFVGFELYESLLIKNAFDLFNNQIEHKLFPLDDNSENSFVAMNMQIRHLYRERAVPLDFSLHKLDISVLLYIIYRYTEAIFSIYPRYYRIEALLRMAIQVLRKLFTLYCLSVSNVTVD